MKAQEALNRANELSERQKELNNYMQENNLSWQNTEDRKDVKVQEAFEIWEEVRSLYDIIFNL